MELWIFFILYFHVNHTAFVVFRMFFVALNTLNIVASGRPLALDCCVVFGAFNARWVLITEFLCVRNVGTLCTIQFLVFSGEARILL